VDFANFANFASGRRGALTDDKSVSPWVVAVFGKCGSEMAERYWVVLCGRFLGGDGFQRVTLG
jgi:hypothetical protein